MLSAGIYSFSVMLYSYSVTYAMSLLEALCVSGTEYCEVIVVLAVISLLFEHSLLAEEIPKTKEMLFTTIMYCDGNIA